MRMMASSKASAISRGRSRHWDLLLLALIVLLRALDRLGSQSRPRRFPPRSRGYTQEFPPSIQANQRGPFDLLHETTFAPDKVKRNLYA